MPPPDCDISELLCRSSYFAYLFGPSDTLISSTGYDYDGTVSYAVIQDLVVSGSLYVGKITLTDNAGQSIVGKGQKEAKVETTAVSAQSIIQITFEGDYSPATRYYIGQKEEGQSFTVVLDKEVSQDVPFSWWIVENQNAKRTAFTPTPAIFRELENFLAPSPTLSVTPSPSPTPTSSPPSLQPTPTIQTIKEEEPL